VFDELSTGQTFGLDAAYFLLDLVTCVFLLALTKEIVHRQSAEQDSAIMRHLLHQQKTQLESSKETIELINVKTHDLKKQIARLGDRIPQDEVDELRELVGIYDAVTRTGNEALDVLLAEKVLLCETRGIQFDRLVDGSALDPMKPGDVYALLGNALDNAMEAVADVSDPGRRYIALRVRRSRGLVAVHVENAYAGERTFVDGLPVTTKADTRYHGFGMRSIRMICEKYDGHLSVAARDGVFSLTVLLPLAAAAARG
jgi:sensor histidine kinase regulating citrate/malate metabolism